MNEESDSAEEVHDIVDQGFLVDIPDIPLPEDDAYDREIVKDECNSAFKMAFVGAGQAGGRMVEAFYGLGYRRVCVVNTTNQDLSGIKIPDENKFIMDIGDGGAGKDPKKGESAVSQYYEDVYDLMRRSFGSEFDRIIVCIGAGGGTGGGSCETIIQISHDIARAFKKESDGSEPIVGALVSLPMTSEGEKVNANAYEVLNSLFSKVGDGGKLGNRSLSPLIVVDNERISKIYPGLPVTKFWGVANQSISSLFHLFNGIAVQDSDFTTFDKADFNDILRSGVVTFGACPLKRWNDSTAISHAIRDNLKRNILVGGFDLGEARTAGCVFIGNKSVLDETPQDYLEHGFETLSRIMGDNSVVHRGIYKGSKEGLVVYTILGELGRPEERFGEVVRIGNITIKQ